MLEKNFYKKAHLGNFDCKITKKIGFVITLKMDKTIILMIIYY